MVWDHSTDLLSDLTQPSVDVYDFVDEFHDSSDDDVFTPSFASSTPRRITRSVVSSGEYKMTLSPIPFQRNSRLR